jgi:hypothetical protein
MQHLVEVQYVGPHDAVEVELFDGRIEVVIRDDFLKTTVEHAEALLEQVSNWKRKPKAKADKPAAK